ncbi:MAG: D-alanyl-D-alanine carboxypeptidase [Agathobacter sp.]|nr:D-alanyl-D-alanine carboxypeptidase [Agathobacter sp.]
MSRVLSIVCVISLFFTGCGFQQTTLTKEYDAYSYHNSFTNQEEVNVNYFAEDVCVTNTINFGLEGTYARVAQGGGIFNVTKNEVLYSQNLFKKLYPASTTKILTAYIILKDCNLNDVVTISEKAANQPHDSSLAGLKAGDHITVHDLLYGLMLNSGNDAADALAEHHSGSVEAFAKVMTEEAHKLGATNSQFSNAHGLTDKNHYTTVYDMYLIFNEALKYDKFVEIISSKSKAVTYTNVNGGTVQKTYYNGNNYLSGAQEVPKGVQVIGGKTGTTYAAGFCLVLYCKNEAGDDIISIVYKADCKHNLYLLMSQILRKYAN